MKLHEALRIIDDTVGMIRTFVEIIEFGELKEKFLLSPVNSCMENYVDFENNDAGVECRQYYTYVEDGKEYKKYIEDIHPVCTFMIDEWPLPIAKKIHKFLNQGLFMCLDLCKEIYGEDNLVLNVPLEDNYNYQRKSERTQAPSTIEDVIFDTIHEMYHALGVVGEFEDESEETTTDENSPITEETASKMDWVRLTDRFDLERIKEVVKNTGKSTEEKRIVVKAIFDALMSIDKLYNIPYSVDKLILQLYLEYGGQRQDLSPTKDKKTKSKPAKSKIPDCLTTPEAEKIWERLRKAGFIIKDGYSLVKGISQNQATYIASCMADKLGIQKKWKTFKQLWNINNMAQMAGSWKQTGKVPPRAKEIRDLM